MLFNSVQFFVFFGIVLGLYRLLDHRWQNRMLLIASYIFYGAWDWRFLSLIWISTFIDFWCGGRMQRAADQRSRRRFLMISVVSNLGILGFFKYFNFFSENLIRLAEAAGWNLHPATLDIILPVGISFYTFQSMSYTIDIYRGELKAHDSLLEFALFVAFFPQLVAGPIERARHLLPQVARPRTVTWEQVCEGSYLILWGLFLKVFVADNLAVVVDNAYSLEAGLVKERVWLGTYAFAFQIFGDFAGYSNIARGVSRCMGFDIMNNFFAPYMAASPSDFWRRWHISLSTWLKDYLYIPLGGNRHGTTATLRNLMLTMVIGGLWHGAAWTFVLWGFYHGVLLVGYRLAAGRLGGARPAHPVVAGAAGVVQVIVFFHFVCLGWMMFRAESLTHFGQLMAAMIWQPPGLEAGVTGIIMRKVAFFAGPAMAVQIVQYWRNDILALYRLPWVARGIWYYALVMLILIYGVTEANDFIYFQF